MHKNEAQQAQRSDSLEWNHVNAVTKWNCFIDKLTLSLK